MEPLALDHVLEQRGEHADAADVGDQEVRPCPGELAEPRAAEHRVAEQRGEEGQRAEAEGVGGPDAPAPRGPPVHEAAGRGRAGDAHEAGHGADAAEPEPAIDRHREGGHQPGRPALEERDERDGDVAGVEVHVGSDLDAGEGEAERDDAEGDAVQQATDGAQPGAAVAEHAHRGRVEDDAERQDPDRLGQVVEIYLTPPRG